METYGLEKLGLVNAGAVYRNLTPAQLVEHALRRGEGTLSNTGALVVKTGKYTGRSANDKFIVDTPAVHDDIAWGKVNRPFEKAKFDAIRAKVLAYLQGRDVFIFDGFAGADPKYTKAFRIVNELASQNLFIHQLLRRPTAEQLRDFHEDYTIIAAPGFKCVPDIDGTRSEAAILVDYEAREVVICGTQYAGEIKKSVFSVMNYVLPKQGVFPMHCSANIGKTATAPCFSASAVPERPPCPPTHSGCSSATMSTAGPMIPCSTSRAAATPSASTSAPRVSRRSTTPSGSAHWWKTW